jgi:phage tail sheath gpL-like
VDTSSDVTALGESKNEEAMRAGEINKVPSVESIVASEWAGYISTSSGVTEIEAARAVCAKKIPKRTFRTDVIELTVVAITHCIHGGK